MGCEWRSRPSVRPASPSHKSALKCLVGCTPAGTVRATSTRILCRCGQYDQRSAWIEVSSVFTATLDWRTTWQYETFSSETDSLTA
jgi:hypothetical protein